MNSETVAECICFEREAPRLTTKSANDRTKPNVIKCIGRQETEKSYSNLLIELLREAPVGPREREAERLVRLVVLSAEEHGVQLTPTQRLDLRLRLRPQLPKQFGTHLQYSTIHKNYIRVLYQDGLNTVLLFR